MVNNGITVVSSYHVKGGCGKTTVLSSLAIYAAYAEEKPVVAIDLDPQGALYYSFTGEIIKPHLPSEREEYRKKLINGMKKASHPRIKELGLDISVALYPTCMFIEDQYHQSYFKSAYSEEMLRVIERDTILIFDMPTSSVTELDVEPILVLKDKVDTYYFLIPCRPLEKEIKDGKQMYLCAREMLMDNGVLSDNIKGVYVLNFYETRNEYADSQRLRLDNDQGFFRSVMSKYGRYFELPEVSETLVETMFPEVDYGLIEGFVILPEIVERKGKDLNLYSILLDSDFKMKESKSIYGLDIELENNGKSRKWTDAVFDRGLPGFGAPDIGEEDPAYESRKQFLDGIKELYGIIFDRKIRY